MLSVMLLGLSHTCLADQKSEWLRRWNQESGNAITYKAEDVILKESHSDTFPGLLAAGFRQSDGGFSLGRVVWKSKSYTPLKAFGVVLSDLGFADMSDSERRALFTGLL